MLKTDALDKWFLIEERPVEGLGSGELLQSATSSSQFKASLILNRYESNCLRDWLSYRWTAKSLERTCIFETDHAKLVITLVLSATHLLDAKQRFQQWLAWVSAERTMAEQSRR